MAQEWCVAYGILSEEKAQEIYKKICKRKGKPCVLTPVKKTSTSVSVAVKASVTETKKKAGRSKRKVIEDDVDGILNSSTHFSSLAKCFVLLLQNWAKALVGKVKALLEYDIL